MKVSPILKRPSRRFLEGKQVTRNDASCMSKNADERIFNGNY